MGASCTSLRSKRSAHSCFFEIYKKASFFQLYTKLSRPAGTSSRSVVTMDASFKGVSEKFNVSLVSDEGYGTERVVAEIGLDGVFISSRDTQRMLRKYPLNHISRWALRDSSLVLYTKTPVDVEEVTVTLQGDDRIVRSALDTLTSCCMQ